MIHISHTRQVYSHGKFDSLRARGSGGISKSDLSKVDLCADETPTATKDCAREIIRVFTLGSCIIVERTERTWMHRRLVCSTNETAIPFHRSFGFSSLVLDRERKGENIGGGASDS